MVACGHNGGMHACLLYGLWVQSWHVCVFASWSVGTTVACMRVCFMVCGYNGGMYVCLLYGLWVQWWHVCVFALWSVGTVVACMRVCFMVCGTIVAEAILTEQSFHHSPFCH